MAYQPKSYRKFAATAATATLVATAVTPAFAAENLPFGDVNQNYAEAVGALYSKGIVNGVSKTEFGTYQSLKRGDAAVIIARALELDTKNAPDAGFKDVNSNIKGAVNALVAKGIISGVSKDKFDPNSPLTRGQMAKILVNAYPTLKDKAKETPFKDLTADFKPYIEALYGAGITGGTSDTTYGTTKNITRGDFAKLLYKAMNFDNVKVPQVDTVQAVNATTVQLKGSNLDQLKADNFSLDGNKVTSYNVDPETGDATLTFEKKFESGKEQTLKLTEKVDGQDKVTELKFTYTLEIKSVEANALTVDDNTANQKLTFKINGEATDADLDYIKASGYNVEFQATSNVFDGTPVSSSSATGVLASDLSSLKDKSFAYKVVITDKDGNTVAESPLAEVKVVDKSSVYTSINSFDIVNNGVKLTSNTVTLSDSNVSIANIKGDLADGTKDAPISSSAVEYSSSNKNVALVDSNGNILPIAPGKTTITLKAGDATKTIDLTVAADARVAKTATVSNSNIKLINSGSPATVSVQVKDQYGDPVKDVDFNPSAGSVSYETTKVDVNGTPTEVVTVTGDKTDSEGKAQLTVTPQAVGDGTVKVKAGNNVIATLNVSVSKDATVASHKLELVDPSQDTTLDLYADDPTKPDDTVKFVYNKYNASGYLLGAEDNISDDNTKQYSVSVDPSDKSIIDASVGANGVITVTAKKAGTANLIIKEGSVVREKVAITVKDSTPTVATATLKSVDKVTKAGTTLNAGSVLTLNDDDLDPSTDNVVQNITLTTPSNNKVRITDDGKLYLDANKNGTLDKDGSGKPTEVVVGTLNITENITSDPTTGTVSITTASGDKGSIVYSVKDNSGKVIATQVIDVDAQ
ncbi:S-layer homology domain-containing protein [Bacillus smithii]|uniref:S-layer homology domain-containing protein n=1 Tax=Bacillus smithii TaxID=1479 RepID=UPI0030C9FABF